MKINSNGDDDGNNKKRKNDIFRMIPNIVFNPSLSVQPNAYGIPNNKTRNQPTIF